MLTPTDEQSAILDAFREGVNIAVTARAGTGKTSTLQMLGQQGRPGIYLAFNRRIREEAERKFAGTQTHCSTVHALAWRTHGARLGARMDSSPKWIKDTDYAKAVGIRSGEKIDIPGKGPQLMRKGAVVRAVRDTVQRFMKSAAESIDDLEITLPEPFESQGRPAQVREMKARVREWARIAWEDMTAESGALPTGHDTYLKTWSLDRPTLPWDVIFFDEAQDADEIMTDIVRRQSHAQVITTGDSEQAIYEWRGAIDAMGAFDGRRLTLTQSFRFGGPIAQTANWWLEALGASPLVRGLASIDSRVYPIFDGSEDAVLTRTNAGAIEEVAAAQQLGIPVGIAGENQARDMLSLAKACLDLQDKGWTPHRDFAGFSSWRDVEEFVQTEDAPDLARLVRIVDRYGADRLIRAIEGCVPPQSARRVVSTAHVAKGLEWSRVRIAPDFTPPEPGRDGSISPIPREEARLAYVAATRARHRLDMRGLAWARNWPAGVAPA